MKLGNRKIQSVIVLAAAINATSLFAATSTNSTGTQINGTGNPAVTISLSGSTAMQSFTVSPGISFLTPGGSITFNNGTGGAPTVYTAPTGASVAYQLASPGFNNADVTTGSGAQRHSALRLEWHAQGSVEGILELVDSQIDDQLLNNTVYNPSTANRVWVNTGSFAAAATPTSLLGIGNNSSSFTARDPLAMNRIQMAISDVSATQGFSVSGAGTFSAGPGTSGYGKGNPLFRSPVTNPVSGLGTASARQQLEDQSRLDMSTDKIDYNTGTFYTSGPWNNGGTKNVENKVVAINATALIANPGTGLDKFNKKDAKWLQMSGRLQNGADFNVTTRDVNSGTRNVFALNTGVDPSWAVGESDTGDTTLSANANPQLSIGSAMRFSGKTGGGGVRDTVRNSRMALGTFSAIDAVAVSRNSNTNPARVLKYRDSEDETATAYTPNYADITAGNYAIWQNQTYVTVKNNNSAAATAINALPTGAARSAAWASANDAPSTGTISVGIKGDNSGNDVFDFRQNILGTVANYDTATPASVANPADQLLATNLILPEFMAKVKTFDGATPTVNPDYNAGLRNVFLGAGIGVAYNPGDASTVFAGAAASTYGGAGTTSAGVTGAVVVTASNNANGTNAGGNWLFGNFNQNGKRDYAAVKSSLDAARKLIDSGAGVSWNSGSLNATVVAGVAAPLAGMANQAGGTGATKGDLIVLGDYDSNGTFDGKDLYLLARGASISDSTSVDTLTPTGGETFGDAYRRGKLNKNAALDFLKAGTASATYSGNTPTNTDGILRVAATASTINDPKGLLAFEKADVNRDGVLDLKDARVVNGFHLEDYTVLDDQINAAIGTNGLPYTDTVNQTPVAISLVDVELTDNGVINISDFAVVKAALGTQLANADANFDGKVDTVDFNVMMSNFGTGITNASWTQGNFSLAGGIDSADFNVLVASFGTIATGALPGVFPGSVVPEPAAVSAVVAMLGGLAIRRRR